jgi:hypothetical protein
MVTPEMLTDEMIREYQCDVAELLGRYPACTVIALAGPPSKSDRRKQYKIDRDMKRWQDARIECAARINARKGGG